MRLLCGVTMLLPGRIRSWLASQTMLICCNQWASLCWRSEQVWGFWSLPAMQLRRWRQSECRTWVHQAPNSLQKQSKL